MARRNDDLDDEQGQAGSTLRPTTGGQAPGGRDVSAGGTSQSAIDQQSGGGAYAGITAKDLNAAQRKNWDLPGFGDRQTRLNQLADTVSGRGAPQAGDSAFRSYQANLANRLQKQLDSGESLAAMQYRQQADQAMAQQRSMAASASPQNQAMAGRMAMQNAANINQGLGSQAAMLGIQERNALQGQLAGIASGARGQDLSLNQFNTGAQLQQTGMNDQAAAQARDLELKNAALQQQGQMGYQQDQTTRYGIDANKPKEAGWLDQVLGVATAVAPAAIMASDERVKKNVSEPSGDDMDKLMREMSAKEFEYKDPSMGEGRRLGVMAQDVEQGGPVGRGLVMATDNGTKALDMPKSLGAALGMISRLGQRVDSLEGKGKPKMMAEGGVVTQPTDAVIGEAGPEAVVPLDPNESDRMGKPSGYGSDVPAAPGAGAGRLRQEGVNAKPSMSIQLPEAEDKGQKKRDAIAEYAKGQAQSSDNKWVKLAGALTSAALNKYSQGAGKEKIQESLFDRMQEKKPVLTAPVLGRPTVALAAGGVVTRPTDALVGERGPEAIVPLGGQPVAARTKQTARGMPGSASPPPPPPPVQQAGRMAAPGPTMGTRNDEELNGPGVVQRLRGERNLISPMSMQAPQAQRPQVQQLGGGGFGGIAQGALGAFTGAGGGQPRPGMPGGMPAQVAAQALGGRPGTPGLGQQLGGIAPTVMMARGGIVDRPTRTILGEAGPEAVIPLHKLPEVVKKLRGVAGDGDYESQGRTARFSSSEASKASSGAAGGLERREELQRERLSAEERNKKMQEYREREGLQRERKEKRSKEEVERDRRKATRAEALRGLGGGY